MEWFPLILSFQVAITATLIAMVLGIALAALLASRPFPGRDLLDVLITAPMVLPPTVLGYYLLVAVGRRSAIGGLYESLTGSPLVFTRTAAILAATVSALPLIVKAGRAALEGVDPMLLRAARTLGAGPTRAFFTVQLPLAGRNIVAGVMLGFARALGEFGVTLMVAGNIPGVTQTASLAIYDAVQANDQSRAMGMTLVLSGVAILSLYIVNKLANGKGADVG